MGVVNNHGAEPASLGVLDCRLSFNTSTLEVGVMDHTGNMDH